MDTFEEDTVLRMVTEEEEAGAEVKAARHAEPALVMVNRNIAIAPIAVSVLIHSCSMIGNILLMSVQGESTVIGSIALPTSRVSCTDSATSSGPPGSCIHRQQLSPGAAAPSFVSCSLSIPPDASVTYVRALLSTVTPSLIVSITDLPEEALLQCGCHHSDVDFYQLPNSKAAELKVQVEKPPQLPPSCMMTGCSAALLSAAEARGIPAVACCHVQHQAYAPPSKAHLLQLSGHVDTILKASKNVAAVESLQLKQAASVAACELQVPEAPRVYL
eukprot:jgi/Ulvmu1/1531/UM011_0261.1